ncbi:unnamed protein product [Miscanthus lutarioriparius]|uniref:PGG domain-containing protein n=1 Tax=Miscanthus lutarioriparius TaxID=422564 RepID=A0A811QNX5_9POAL|nr:unnamed protein product [Miscanthus lutarioriparius]
MATPPPPMQQPPQCDHERMVVGNMCPSLYRAASEGRMAERRFRMGTVGRKLSGMGWLWMTSSHSPCSERKILVTKFRSAMRSWKEYPASPMTSNTIDPHGVVMHGQCDILELTAERNTALHVAAEQGHHELIRELYRRFKDQGLLSRQNSALDTPMHCAARAGHARAVAVLVELARDRGREHSGMQERGRRHGPAPGGEARARARGGGEMVHLLLEWRPALADQVDCSGSSPLHFASSDGDRSIVRAILRAGPPGTVYKKDSSGLSSLHVAARMGHHHVVTNMLRSCPDAAELRDGNGRTFVHAAAREKRSSVVLLATKNPMLRGLLDAQDREGNTPLHLAVAAGSTRIVEDLLHNGKFLQNGKPGGRASRLRGTAPAAEAGPTGAVGWPRHGAEGIQNTSDSLTVVAGLIVAAAFAAGFNLPGGYGDDGKVTLKDETVFKSFLLLNTGAVATSVLALVLLVYGKASSHSAGSWKTFAAALQLLWVSLVCMMLAFQAALFSVATTRALTYGFLVVYTCILVVQICITTWLGPATRLRTIWRFHWKGRRHVNVKRQYPFAKATVLNLQLFTATSFLGSLGFQVIFLLSRISRRSKDTSIAPSPSALYY